jgi:hypothetical protein
MYHQIRLQRAVSLLAVLLLLLGCRVLAFGPKSAPAISTPIAAWPTSTSAPVPPTLTPGSIPPTGMPSPSSTNTPTATRTSTPTHAPTNTPVPSPTHTPTPAPTDTLSPTYTPALPTATPTPTPPPFDFIIVHQRIWTNEENGGVSINGTVNGCGYGHQIYVWVLDAASNPLDGVVIGDTFNNPRHISGEKGPGHAQYDLYMNGYRLLVVEDNNAGRPVTSQISEVMSSNDWEIPIPWLIEGHYCATEEECIPRRADPNRVGTNSLCWGHYSYEIVFQRTW